MKVLGSLVTATSLYALCAIGAAAPINWDIQLEAFERVYKPHPACTATPPSMGEMECNNFRARALKRFQAEWEGNAYWRNGAFTPNPRADKRVNSELPK